MRNAAIIVAAGRGRRAAKAGALPKQYLPLGGQMVLTRSLAAFVNHPEIDAVLPVIHADDLALFAQSVATLNSPKLMNPVTGGESRQQTVVAGLEALASHRVKHVLIHDAARPFVSARIIAEAISALSAHRACLTALPLSDTLKSEKNGLVERTISRDGLWRAQTPQAFHFSAILDAHRSAAAQGLNDFTDDAAIAEWHGIDVALSPGSERNIKLTNAEDFHLAEQFLKQNVGEFRNGTGFDVHAFEPGDAVILCGVEIPHNRKLKGHSDADVGLHALTDALLGAVGLGDIGHHFPPSDARWKDADSSRFLIHAAKLLARKDARIVNVDVTLICENPKIGPYREAMRARVAQILALDIDRVSIKATTTEGLGFTGRAEGIAAMASATIEITPKE